MIYALGWTQRVKSILNFCAEREIMFFKTVLICFVCHYVFGDLSLNVAFTHLFTLHGHPLYMMRVPWTYH